jgi:hypothetical protein
MAETTMGAMWRSARFEDLKVKSNGLGATFGCRREPRVDDSLTERREVRGRGVWGLSGNGRRFEDLVLESGGFDADRGSIV